MTRARSFRLFVILFAIGTSHLSAQSVKDSIKYDFNIDSLSADDRLLFNQYKDSFDAQLLDFMFTFSGLDTSVADMDRRSHVEVGLDFASKVLVNGRYCILTDYRSVSDNKLHYYYQKGVEFFPSLTYFHKTGLYFGLSATFYTDTFITRKTDVPIILPTAGFQRTFFKRWTVGAGYTRAFLTYGSAVSRRLMDNTFSLNTGIDIWKKLIFSAGISAYWSSLHSRLLPSDEKRSVEITLTLKKEFLIYHFLGAKIFSIVPAINAYVASDNRSYVRAAQIADGAKDSVIQKAGISNFFGFLDLEPSLLLDWRIRNLDIYVLPTLAIPFYVYDEQTSMRVENPHFYRFYMQAGIKYLFAAKKKTGKKKT
jgi:hypothetical protein